MYLQKTFVYNLSVCLGFAFVALLLMMPLFVGDRVFSDDDPYLYYYQAFDFYGDALRSGESFLWNPYLFSGFPMYASQSGGFFDPLNMALFSLWDGPHAYHARVMLGIYLGMLAAYGAARSLGISRTASVVVGLGYPLIFQFSSSILISNTLFLMPALVVVVHRILSSEGWKRYAYAGIGGVAIGWGFLAGYAQLTVFATFLAGLYAVSVSLFAHTNRSIVQRITALAGPLCVMVCFACVVALPILLSVLTLLPYTVRHGGLSYIDAHPEEMITLLDAVRLILPNIVVLPHVSAGIVPLYIGIPLIIGVVAALYGVFATRNAPAHPPAVYRRNIYAAGIPFCFALFAAVAHSPLFYVLNNIPVFSFFRFPGRWLYLGSFFLILIGGLGIDMVRRHNAPHFSRVLVMMGIVAGIAIGLVCVVAAFARIPAEVLAPFFALLPFGSRIGSALETWQQVSPVTSGAFLFSVCMLALGFGALYAYARMKSERTAQVFLVSVAVINLVGVYWIQWHSTSVPLAIRSGIPELIARVPEELRDKFRFYPFGLDVGSVRENGQPSLEDLTAFQYDSAWPNAGGYYHVRSADGFDNFIPKPYLAALTALGSAHGARDATQVFTPEDREKALLSHLDVLGMLNVRYVVSGKALIHDSLHLVASSTPSPSLMPLLLYEYTKALPRAYSPRTTVRAFSHGIEDLIHMGSDDFGNTTYLDCFDCIAGSFSGEVVIESSQHGLYRIKSTGAAGRYVVLSESFVPGWRVRIDGMTGDIIRANGVFMAVFVPSGEHTVEFEYQGLIGELRALKWLGLVRPVSAP